MSSRFINLEDTMQDTKYLSTLPETGYVRLKQIVGNAKANPPIPALFPVGTSTWWAGVRDGRYPRSVKLSPRVTAWRIEDIRHLIEATSNAAKGVV
jgi:prophage regulatory protein